MTVFENIAVSLKLKKVPAAQIQRQVRETAHLLGLEDLLERKPRALSGGQRQRVALGRAIIRQPKVFLLDEPLSNLDAILRERMRAELKLLFNNLGATVIYVTHDQTEAMTLSSRIALLHEGRIQQFGAPEEIYRKPANVFVAGFLGSPRINILKCRVAGDGLSLGGQTIRVSRQRLQTLQGRAEVLLGVRPENVQVGDGPLAGRVQVVEPLGALTLLIMTIDDQKLQALVEPGGVLTGNVRLRLDEEHFHFFDPKTEARL
jgi:multiple sugar transport system ATP-binding protein